MTEYPYLSLLSSVGISRHLGDVVQVMHCAPDVDRRTLLARASEAAESNPLQRSLDETLESTIREARRLTGVTIGAPALQRTNYSLDFSPLDYSGRRQTLDVDWDSIEQSIWDLGYSVQQPKFLTFQNALVNTSSVIPLVEVASKSSNLILAGGKGSSLLDARIGAIGEFAERYMAALPNTERIFASSAKQLRRLGFVVPELIVGGRDSYSSDLVIDWTEALTLDGRPAALPAERVYYEYIPRSGVRAFAWQHTVGLAAGASLEEAVWAGLCECLERDAYWLLMRCRLSCPTIPLDQFLYAQPGLKLALEDAGLSVVLKDCSLDWPLQLVHATVIDVEGRVPAYAHGMGSGLTLDHAVIKAVLESLQIRFGLAKLSAATPAKATLPSPSREAVWLWSDPASFHLLQHLLEDTELPIRPMRERMKSIRATVAALETSGYEIAYSIIGKFDALTVVRVCVTDALLPEPTCENLPPRLATWVKRAGLRIPYPDPILT